MLARKIGKYMYTVKYCPAMPQAVGKGTGYLNFSSSDEGARAWTGFELGIPLLGICYGAAFGQVGRRVVLPDESTKDKSEIAGQTFFPVCQTKLRFG